MGPVIAVLLLIEQSQALIRRYEATPRDVGYAKWYSEGTMERVYRTRQRQGLADSGWTGNMVEVIDCNRIGELVSFRLDKGPTELALVVDCSDPTPKPDGSKSDAERHRDSGLWLEVSYPIAKRYGLTDGCCADLAEVWYWGIRYQSPD